MNTNGFILSLVAFVAFVAGMIVVAAAIGSGCEHQKAPWVRVMLPAKNGHGKPSVAFVQFKDTRRLQLPVGTVLKFYRGSYSLPPVHLERDGGTEEITPAPTPSASPTPTASPIAVETARPPHPVVTPDPSIIPSP
jgi:hypothetical protein